MLNKLTYVFCDDDYLLEINNKFLKHNYYTDIITFDLSEEKDKIIGEVYISSERVLENSKIVEVSFQEELHRVIFHGVLHLVGYKDKSVKEAREIRRKEGFYLGKYFK